MTDAFKNLAHELPDEHNAAAGYVRSPLAAAVHEQRDLIDLVRNRDTGKESRNVPSANLEFLAVTAFACRPAVRIERRLDVNQSFLLRVKSHDVEFAVVTTLGPLADLDIAADEIAA